MKLRYIYSLAVLLMILTSANTVNAKNVTIRHDAETVEICEKELPYTWRGQVCSVANTYTDEETHPFIPKSTDPEDVESVDTLHVYTLVLKTYKYVFGNKTVDICDECSFWYQGHKYDLPGVYNETIPRTNDCDSIFSLTIRIADGWHFFDTLHTCAGQAKEWRGKTLTKGGDYTDPFKTVDGLHDSVYHVHLVEHDPIESFETVTICASEKFYWWMGKARSENGDYTETRKTKYGCDSVCHLNLTVLPLPEPVKKIEYFCQGQGVITHGTKVEKDTTITDTLTAINGCDSVVITQYIMYPSNLIEEVIQHYENEPINWRERTIQVKRDTIINDTIPGGNIFGCDSIYRLRLITKVEVSREVVRCAGQTAMHGITVVKENTVFRDTLFAKNGADSIILTSYNFIQPFYSEEKISICSNQYVEWVGHPDRSKAPIDTDEAGKPIYPNKILHEPGLYYDTYHLATGCDSTYVVEVVHRPAYLHDTLVIWCNDSLDAHGPWTYTVGNKTFTWSQHDVDTIIADTLSHSVSEVIQYPIGEEGWEPLSGGCDSIERIHLIVTDRCSELDRIPLCRDGSVTVDGKVYTQPGRYFNTMPSSRGLNVPDSTHSFEIYIVEPAETQTEIVVCERELPYKWHGQWLRKNGNFETHLQTQYGCDSLVKLHFIVVPTVFSEVQTYHFCAGEEEKITLPSGREINPIGDVSELINDTLQHLAKYKDLEGVEHEILCDTIVRVQIFRHPSFFSNDTVWIKRDGSFTWKNHLDSEGKERIFTKPDIYWDSCHTAFGCDSIYRLVLKEAPSYYFYKKDSICENELPYLWRGRECYEAKTYVDALKSYYEMDSIYELELIIHKSYLIDTTVTICNDTKLTIRNKEIPLSQFIYDDTLKTQVTGCDSIYRYHINRIPKTIIDEGVQYIEEGKQIIWRGRICKALGSYYDTIRSQRPDCNCDSIIYTFELRYDRPFSDTQQIKICQSETLYPYEWRDRVFYSDTIVADTLRTSFLGLDSIYRLELTVYPSYAFTKQLTLCPGQTYALPSGKIISGNATEYREELQTIHGCDSITTYTINRFEKDIRDTVAYVEKGKAIIWHDQECETLGFYYDTITSVLTGCDSIIYRMELRNDQPFLDETKLTICQSETPFMWRDRAFYSDTTLEDVFHTSFLKLDSVYRLELTVNPTFRTSETQYVCKGEGVYFKGEYITTPGEYEDHVQSTKGCDSIHVLNLVRAPSYFFYDTITFVNDSDLPLTWPNHTLNKPIDHEGIYFDSLLTTHSHPCDSVYQLTVLRTYSYSFTKDTSICEGEYFDWFGTKYYESGTYTKAYKSQYNLDSIYVLHLTVNPVKETYIYYSLCEGEKYDFFGDKLSEPNIYRDTLINPDTHCDSIFILVLNKYETAPTVVNHVLCEGESISINGKDITHSGEYYDTIPAFSNACDSVIRHIVTVGKPYYFEEARVINEGKSYTWHKNGQPIVLTEEGDYFDSCFTTLGCDSIMKLVLRINKEKYDFPPLYDTICSSNLPYIWNTFPTARVLTQEGWYYDSCKTVQGADSVHSLHLTILPSSSGQQTLDFCEGEQAVFNGIPYITNSVVKETITNSKGCDSVVSYFLHFYPKYSISKTVKVTKGKDSIVIDQSSIAKKDTVIRSEGVYTFRLRTIHGCDSVVTYVVDACDEPIYVIVPYNMCQGDVLTVNGNKQITQPGDYDFFFRTANGCDSIVRYVVRFNPAYEFNASATMCRNSTYTWWGHKNDTVITRQGTYYDSLKTTLGCDSVYCLKISYRRTDIRDTIVSICSSDLPYQYKGGLYHEDRVFYDTLANNTDGCDSLIRWNFKVNSHCSDYVHYNRCFGHYITIDGQAIAEQGTYTHHHLTEDGQDSLYRFTVHDVANYEFTTELSGCDSIVYQGKTYYARGVGQESFTIDLNHRTTEGCDSLEHLKMTIHTSSPTHVYSKVIADFDSVRFGPYFYNTTGTYSLNYTNSHGCDSMEVLNLTVLPTQYEDIVHYTVCQDDPRGIEIFGREFHPTKEYTFISDTIWIAGQPIIRTADIVMQIPFKIREFDPNQQQLICSAHEAIFDVNYSTFDPQVLPDYYEVDFLMGDIEAHPIHQDGIINGKTTLPITMNGQGKYITPGYYRYYLTFRSESCSRSDTTVMGTIMVSYPDDVMEATWDDAVMLVNEHYNGGGWIFKAPYKWQVLSAQGVDKTARIVKDASLPYICSPELEEGDRISATLYREGYDLPIPTCEYIFKPLLQVLEHGILIYPSAVQCRTHVTLSTTQPGTYRLYDQTGRTCSSGNFQSGETQIMMPASTGCYIIIVEDESGLRKTQKLMVY